MRELIIVDLCGMDYGAWRDEISKTIEARSIHRLPLIPPYIAGLAIVEHRTVTVADLSVCMGLSPTSALGKNNIFIMPDAAEISGFAVGNKAVNISVPDEAVLPIPSFLRTDVVQSAVVVKQDLIPVINIAELYRIVRTDGAACPDFRSVGFPQSPVSDGELRLFMSNGEIFAMPSAGLNEGMMRPERLTRVALAPAYVKGITFSGGKIMPVLSLAELMMTGGSGTEEVMITAETGGEVFGLLADRDEGTLQGKDCKIMPLPLLARQSWMKSAAVRGREIIPVIEILELMSRQKGGEGDDRPAETYSPSSSFETVFGRKDVEVVEFSIFGMRYSLPKAEVQDIIGIKSFRALPLTKSIVVGVSEYDGELLPVLDLGVCFGRRSVIKAEWKMIVVTNGNFRALVVTEAVFESKLVEVSNERELPILLPHGIVYGCYVETSDVRVILNIEAIAVCIDWTSFRQMTESSISEGLESLNHEFKPLKEEFLSFPAGWLEQEGYDSEKVAETEQLIHPVSIINGLGKDAQGTSINLYPEEASYDPSNIEPSKEAILETGNLHIETAEIRKTALLTDEGDNKTEEVNQQIEAFEEPCITAKVTQESLEGGATSGEYTETTEILASEADESHSEPETPVEIEERGTLEIAAWMSSPDAVDGEIPGKQEAHADLPSTEENTSGVWDMQEAAADSGVAPLSSENQEPYALLDGSAPLEWAPSESAVIHEETYGETTSEMERAEAEVPLEENTSGAWSIQETMPDSIDEPLSLENQEPAYPPLDESAPLESAPSESAVIHEETYSETTSEMEQAEAEEPLGDFVLKEERPDDEFPGAPGSEGLEQHIPAYFEEEYIVNPYYKETEGIDAMRRNAAIPDVKLDPATLRKILQKEVKEIENPKIISEKMRSRLIYSAAALVILCAGYLLFMNKGHEVKPEGLEASIEIRAEKPVVIKPEAAVPQKQPEETKDPKRQEVKSSEASSPVKEEKTTQTKSVPETGSDKPKMTHDTAGKDIYLVKRGDTLWGISKRFTGDPHNYNEFARKNKIANPDKIYPKQKINLTQ